MESVEAMMGRVAVLEVGHSADQPSRKGGKGRVAVPKMGHSADQPSRKGGKDRIAVPEMDHSADQPSRKGGKGGVAVPEMDHSADQPSRKGGKGGVAVPKVGHSADQLSRKGGRGRVAVLEVGHSADQPSRKGGEPTLSVSRKKREFKPTSKADGADGSSETQRASKPDLDSQGLVLHSSVLKAGMNEKRNRKRKRKRSSDEGIRETGREEEPVRSTVSAVPKRKGSYVLKAGMDEKRDEKTKRKGGSEQGPVEAAIQEEAKALVVSEVPKRKRQKLGMPVDEKGAFLSLIESIGWERDLKATVQAARVQREESRWVDKEQRKAERRAQKLARKQRVIEAARGLQAFKRQQQQQDNEGAVSPAASATPRLPGSALRRPSAAGSQASSKRVRFSNQVSEGVAASAASDVPGSGVVLADGRPCKGKAPRSAKPGAGAGGEKQVVKSQKRKLTPRQKRKGKLSRRLTHQR